MAWPDIRVWMAALHIAAVLVLTGFIVKLAQEQFIGISLVEWGPADLSTLSGRWLVDSVLLSSQWALQNSGYAILLLVVTLGVVSALLQLRRLPSSLVLARASTISLICISLLTLLFKVYIPVMSLGGWLTTSLQDRFSPPPGSTESRIGGRVSLSADYFAGRAKELDRTVFLSRASKVDSACISRSGSVLPASIIHAADGAKGDWISVARIARSRLEGMYSTSFLICIACWIMILTQPRPSSDSVSEFVVTIGWETVTFVLLPMSTLLIPYTYGKLIGPTVFPHADVQRVLQGSRTRKDLDRFMVERSDSITSFPLSKHGSHVATIELANAKRPGLPSSRFKVRVTSWKIGTRDCWWQPPIVVPPMHSPVDPWDRSP